MKHICIFVSIFFIGGLFSANAADTIVLKDGNMIDAKVMEISPSEIKYKRADNLNGPMIILPSDRVFSIKYENGVVDIINAFSSAGQQSGQTTGSSSSGAQQPGVQTAAQTLLQTSLLNTLNGLPAIKIAGNNLKFQFNGNNWTAMLNGESFSTGSIEVEDTDGGAILNLKQTHIWPGAVAGKVAGKLAGKVPGGAVAGSALSAAGGLAGAIEASGPVIVLEYKAGPPPKLSYLRSAGESSAPLSEPVSIVLADGQWIQWIDTEKEPTRKDTSVRYKIANEEIVGQKREVLTVITNLANGSGWRICTLETKNEEIVQTLRRGSGVRFKVLGDGKRWKLQVLTDEAMPDYCHYEVPIITKNGKLVEIDIPYKKLKQPAWGKKVPFIKSSINGLHFHRSDDIGGTGPSTIKVFDFEIY